MNTAINLFTYIYSLPFKKVSIVNPADEQYITLFKAPRWSEMQSPPHELSHTYCNDIL